MVWAGSLLAKPIARTFSIDRPLRALARALAVLGIFPHIMFGTAMDVAFDCSILTFNALKSRPFLVGPLAFVHALSGSPRWEAPQKLLKGQG